MKAIWKFPVMFEDVNSIMMPKGAKVLTVQMQAGSPVIWAIVDPESELVDRRFRLLGTGQHFDDWGDYVQYVGTFQDGGFVGHLFDFLI